MASSPPPQAQPLEPAIINEIQAVLAQARRGDIATARMLGVRALNRTPGQPVLSALMGALYCQEGDFAAAIPPLGVALRANPEDSTIAFNLATALTRCGDTAAALAICSEDAATRETGGRIWRLRGYLLQLAENYADAAAAYQKVVDAFPGDFEAWNNLGNARGDAGESDAAITALRHAHQLQADNVPVRLNLAAALSHAGRIDEAEHLLIALVAATPGDPKPLTELAAIYKAQGRIGDALATLARAAALAPNDADLQVKLGLERIADWDMAGGEEALERAIAADPAHGDAHLLTGLIYEHTNRADRFQALIASARGLGVAEATIAFIRALAHRRDRQWQAGLDALDMVDAAVEPVRVLQMRGQFLDRLGDAEGAFAAFQAMNALLEKDPSDPSARAAAFRTRLARDTALLTAEWHTHWRPAPAAAKSPIFLVGFPRSGTTLLDTMLMGHPQIQVMEEQPPLNHVEALIGGIDRLAALDEAEIAAARDLYFEKAGEVIALDPQKLLVDKSPMHLNKAALIHRLFPNAKFILALRHPADVALSCFTTNFRLNDAMANFIDLDTTATLYDMSFQCWTQARDILSLDVHEVKYEAVVDDAPTELRRLFDFLGLAWHEGTSDHRKTALDRGVISTASYAQVTEPLYKRSAGRWRRYHPQLTPILPTLAPWIDGFGYSLDQ